MTKREKRLIEALKHERALRKDREAELRDMAKDRSEMEKALFKVNHAMCEWKEYLGT